VPGFDWKLGLSSSSSHNYNKLTGEAIYSPAYLHGLTQHNYSRKNGNLHEITFSKFTDFSVKYDYMIWCTLIFITLLVSQN
jgi:hypothetical protein